MPNHADSAFKNLSASDAGLMLTDWSDKKLDQAITLLTKNHTFPGLTERVRYVAAGSDIVLSLTFGLLRRGIDPKSFELSFLAIGGDMMTKARYK